jgi:tRNA pseudouridine55 synthase
MDGVLVVDKPQGPTSHDVVAVARRVLRERRVGHTGTLDPMATGVLPLVVGRATRLARFLAGARKRYEAVIVLGIATDTYDAMGQPIGGVRLESADASLPSPQAIREALNTFRGTIEQVPPAFSAKKVGGVAVHRMARGGGDVPQLSAADVVVHELGVTAFEGDRLSVEVEVSSGFYVRSLAHDLGEMLGCGAHLASLRRTASGEFTLDGAVTLDRLADAAPARGLVPFDELLGWAPAVRLTEEGTRRAGHGLHIAAVDVTADERSADDTSPVAIRLLTFDGHLLGVAEPKAGAARWPLHPSVVLT